MRIDVPRNLPSRHRTSSFPTLWAPAPLLPPPPRTPRHHPRSLPLRQEIHPIAGTKRANNKSQSTKRGSQTFSRTSKKKELCSIWIAYSLGSTCVISTLTGALREPIAVSSLDFCGNTPVLKTSSHEHKRILGTHTPKGSRSV